MGYSYTPHSREKTSKMISFVEPIVCKLTFQNLQKFITIGPKYIDGEKIISIEREF